MHEMSVAQSIVKMAITEASKHHAEAIKEIELDIGILSGIEMASFDFVWPFAIKGSVLEHAELRVNRIAGKAQCHQCHIVFPIDNFFDACPHCNHFDYNITAGKEIRVKQLKMITLNPTEYV